ncbi:hypothetical protein [Pelagibacterium lacus]|uniref:Uncharacterized protein n=1 Tax=Pelagibacterium lacus TaxID=2282655 RepID=A0A369W5E9_9HYPH|nr:hypothetical protein [Pelagibacterium lacus]RDE08482.1 hypothetical protein DVH29_11470 [Pelagibacterium lacus]
MTEEDRRKAPPPETVEELRNRIDRGETGDKVDWPDPAASPLGTDDEAGGYPPTREELRLETQSASIATPQVSSWRGVIAYAGIAAAVLIVFVAIIWQAGS